jgi:hypothetical protein
LLLIEGAREWQLGNALAMKAVAKTLEAVVKKRVRTAP